MSNFENGANLATDNATGNIDILCLGDSNMDFSYHNKLDTLKDNGQPLLDGLGQNIGARSMGQNGKDRSETTAGSRNGQQGIGSMKDTEAHTNAPNTHEATARDHGHKGKSKQTYDSFFKDNRAPSEASRLNYIETPVGNLVLGIEEIDSVEKAYGFCLVGYVMGPRPSPYALLNYVKGWGNDVKFTFCCVLDFRLVTPTISGKQTVYQCFDQIHLGVKRRKSSKCRWKLLGVSDTRILPGFLSMNMWIMEI